MRKAALLLVLVFMALSVVNCQSMALENSIESPISAGVPFKGVLTVPATDLVKVDISLVLPYGWSISSWSIEGNSTLVGFDAFDTSYVGELKSFAHWNLSGPLSAPVHISYFVAPLATGGSSNISVIWVSPDGFGKVDSVVSVPSTSSELASGGEIALCGDGVCDMLNLESVFNCPGDCFFTFLQNKVFLVGLLAAVFVIMIVGLMYREYRKYGLHLTTHHEGKSANKEEDAEFKELESQMRGKIKKIKDNKARKVSEEDAELDALENELEGKPLRKSAKHERHVSFKKAVVKRKAVKKSVKPKKTVKKKEKKAVKRAKSVGSKGFYSDTIKRLENIRKYLK